MMTSLGARLINPLIVGGQGRAAWMMALGSLTVIYPNPNLGTLSVTLNR
jgi:hypothetical protein